jgi:hypothetical protein
MQARRIGTGAEFRLFQDEQEIGYVDGTAVSFFGFESRDDAALAAWTANSALARRRAADGPPAFSSGDVFIVDQGPSQAVISPAGVLATLLPPAPDGSDAKGWGFEIALLPKERVEVFALARARVIWRALRSTGIYRRMQQFAAERSASI